MFPETGFAVADGPIGNYFTARGGVRTFGPPISNAFPLLGSTVQVFRNHMLKVEPLPPGTPPTYRASTGTDRFKAKLAKRQADREALMVALGLIDEAEDDEKGEE